VLFVAEGHECSAGVNRKLCRPVLLVTILVGVGTRVLSVVTTIAAAEKHPNEATLPLRGFISDAVGPAAPLPFPGHPHIWRGAQGLQQSDDDVDHVVMHVSQQEGGRRRS
jgi:hypothetical protein